MMVTGELYSRKMSLLPLFMLSPCNITQSSSFVGVTQSVKNMPAKLKSRTYDKYYKAHEAAIIVDLSVEVLVS